MSLDEFPQGDKLLRIIDTGGIHPQMHEEAKVKANAKGWFASKSLGG
jgi:hypothetical protein